MGSFGSSSCFSDAVRFNRQIDFGVLYGGRRLRTAVLFFCALASLVARGGCLTRLRR